MKDSSNTVYGLVLCGGLSSRMGRDKALIDYHGVPQYEWVSNLLKPFCTKVFCSVSETLQEKITALKIVDTYKEQGPLGGIVSAFELGNDVDWLIVSCDMPHLIGKDVEHLIAQRDSLVCYQLGAFINPLFSYWPKGTQEAVIRLFKSGERSPKAIFSQLEGRLIQAQVPERHDNINDDRLP